MKSETKFTVLIAICAITSLTCLIIQWYPIFVINGLYTRLKQPALQIEERWNLQGSLDWWLMHSLLTPSYQWLSNILFWVSIILFGYFAVSIREYGGAGSLLVAAFFITIPGFALSSYIYLQGPIYFGWELSLLGFLEQYILALGIIYFGYTVVASLFNRPKI